MEALAEAFGASWEPFLASLQASDTALEDLREYSAADLGQAVVEAISCNVHRKMKLTKALRAYFGSQPNDPASTATTTATTTAAAATTAVAATLPQPPDDPQRMRQLMTLYQQRMMAMGQEMQMLGMKGDMEAIGALQAKLINLSQEVQLNVMVGGGVSGLEKALGVGPGPINIDPPPAPGNLVHPALVHSKRVTEFSEVFSSRVQALSDSISEAASTGQSTAQLERRMRWLSKAYREAMAKHGEEQLHALQVLFEREQLTEEVVPHAPWSAFEGAWSGRLGSTWNYDVVLFKEQIACELLCGPLEIEPGRVRLRICEDPTPSWGNCNWIDVTLEALEDGELRAEQVCHLCDGNGTLAVKAATTFFFRDEDASQQVAKSFHEKRRTHLQSKESRWKRDLVTAVRLCHTEPSLLLLESVTQEGLVKDINDRVEEGTGNTLLHCAAAANRPELCKLLIDRKADVNKYGAGGKLPLDLALASKAADSIAFLVRHNGKASTVLLFDCISRLLVPAVEAIVELLSPNDLRTYQEEDTVLTRLLGSTSGTSPELRTILKTLLDGKADPNQVSTKYTQGHPLALAIQNHPTVVETLLEGGCVIYQALSLKHKSDLMHHPPVLRRTLLTCLQDGLQAVLSDDVPAVELHLKGERRQAMLNLPDEFGFSMLDHACLHGCASVVTRLAKEFNKNDLEEFASFAAWGGLQVPWAKHGDQYNRLQTAAAMLQREDRALLCWKGQEAAAVTRQQRRREEAAVASALQSRMQEGIEEATSRVRSFYDADYRAPPLLKFFADLDEAAIPRSFAEKPIILWDTKRATVAAVLKDKDVHPLFVAVIFMYTLESDVYRVCNRVMRDADEAGIAAWRPFIYHLDQALLGLPAQSARLYRGIAIPFDLAKYDVGKTVHWTSFTSASAVMDVAVSFLQGDFGLLFIIQQEAGRAISAYSFYPHEAELLHRPNSVWRVTGIFEADAKYNLQAKALDAEQAKGLSKVVITMEEVPS
eukprot:GGOE01047267.1.p1 GENE.GGOE01047267.1~~GGOE01047267.1.p1  ORF type:complete len:1004 (+),score=367.44 GGOE01047267.1:36-3014(+)